MAIKVPTLVSVQLVGHPELAETLVHRHLGDNDCFLIGNGVGFRQLRQVVHGNTDGAVPSSGEWQWFSYVNCNSLNMSFLGKAGVAGLTTLFYVLPHTDPVELLPQMIASLLCTQV